MGQIKTVALANIRLPKIALRGVKTDEEGFKGLIESIRMAGFIGAISVRERTDAETGNTYYEVMDGSQRYAACQALGYDEIPVDICDMDDEQVLVNQIMMNAHRLVTKPMEYCQQILRILNIQPSMTFAELASNLGKSTKWVESTLRLKTIVDEDIRKLIDDGVISLSNAYALSKLPPEEQLTFSEQAKTDNANTFNATVKARLRELTAQKRAGKSSQSSVFTPVPHLRRMNVLKEQLENPESIIAEIDASGTTDVHEAGTIVLKWVMGLDPASVERQKEEFEERQRLIAERKAEKQREKEARESNKEVNLENL